MLTKAEQEALDISVKLWDNILYIMGNGPNREEDLRELRIPLHIIQNAILSQGARRECNLRELGG